MQPIVSAALLSCVHFEGLPDVGAAEEARSLYTSTPRAWDARVRHARALVRRWSRNGNFTLTGTAGERFTTETEIREQYGGILLVGDSQIRELAWALLKALTPSEELRFGTDGKQIFTEGKSESARLRSRRRLRGACLPQSVGKLGFTAVCYRARQAESSRVCEIFSPFHNSTHMEQSKQQWLFRKRASHLCTE